MNYYLGIDGGGTTTKFLLSDSGGTIVGEFTGKTSHYMQVGFDGLFDVISKGVNECLHQANLGTMERITHVFTGLGSYGEIKQDDIPIRETIRKAFPNVAFSVGNDGENALAGALGGEPGINIVAGTGSIAFGRNRFGDIARCGGWHQLLGGDEGSGYWFGQQIIHEFTRQSDGRDDRTLLYDNIREHFDLDDDFDLVRILVTEWDYDRTRIASLSTLVAELATAGDPYCNAWFKQAAQELCDLARAVQNQLSLPAGTLVAGTGGIFKSGDLILTPFESTLEKYGLSYSAPLFSPDRGALILAMQNGGLEISDEIRFNLLN